MGPQESGEGVPASRGRRPLEYRSDLALRRYGITNRGIGANAPPRLRGHVSAAPPARGHHGVVNAEGVVHAEGMLGQVGRKAPDHGAGPPRIHLGVGPQMMRDSAGARSATVKMARSDICQNEVLEKKVQFLWSKLFFLLCVC